MGPKICEEEYRDGKRKACRSEKYGDPPKHATVNDKPREKLHVYK